MKLLRRHYSIEGWRSGGLPMTSMIDVVFLLLIFFLVTVSSTAPESELSSTLSPQSEASGAGAVLQPQIVSVERRGDSVVYRLGSHELSSREGLLALLVELPRESGVVVKVANDVPVEAAAGALQACKDAGFVKVSYVPWH
jgi:biopolymer transport protein ExbD